MTENPSENSETKNLLKQAQSDAQAIRQRFSEIETRAQEVEQKAGEVEGHAQEVQQKLSEAKNAVEEINRINNSINNLNNSLFFDKEEQKEENGQLATDDQGKPVMVAIPSFKTRINKYEEEIREIESDIKDSHHDIDDFYNQLIVGNEDEASIQEQIAQFQKEQNENLKGIVDSMESRRKEQEEEYAELYKKIEGLLPGATAAGLSESFNKAKEENKEDRWLWTGFLLSALATLMVYCYLFFPMNNTNDLTVLSVIVRLSSGFPLMWIAWYCQRSISAKRQIREQYHHKQRIMSLYDGLAKQFREADESGEKLHKLMEVVIGAVAVNPAEKLDKERTIVDNALPANMEGSRRGTIPTVTDAMKDENQ